MATKLLDRAPRELVIELLLAYSHVCQFCKKRHHVPTVGELIDYIKTTGGGKRDMNRLSDTAFGQGIRHWLAQDKEGNDVLHLVIITYHLAWTTSGTEYVTDGHDD
jgi:hypothetical protein